MRVLLDTHALLWLIAEDVRLSQPARQAFLDSDYPVQRIW